MRHITRNLEFYAPKTPRHVRRPPTRALRAAAPPPFLPCGLRRLDRNIRPSAKTAAVVSLVWEVLRRKAHPVRLFEPCVSSVGTSAELLVTRRDCWVNGKAFVVFGFCKSKVTPISAVWWGDSSVTCCLGGESTFFVPLRLYSSRLLHRQETGSRKP